MDAAAANKIVDLLFADLNDRRELHIDSCDDETQAAIREAWVKIIVDETSGGSSGGG